MMTMTIKREVNREEDTKFARGFNNGSSDIFFYELPRVLTISFYTSLKLRFVFLIANGDKHNSLARIAR